ncbi:unnamed protein product [Chondrus crispus]|uniref:Uncharacterized protein n=1 Tax=Chondrus crispus TaxID=2769 RepID=R7Q7P7_CHOCR|nr:unnamed protein product [Chondrus crispus]CDF33858.1 unnamed protein product [Chondrus crispus]|eukprot:XP_005713677.1 unnamed protein product [Chondrus crispus]
MDAPSRAKPPPLSRLLLTTVAMAGIQVCYAAQINFGTSHLKSLGMPLPLVSLAWLAGPLSGLLMQPLVGFASDRCTSRLGRRRPFLLLGTIFTVLALLLFAFSRRLAHAFLAPPRAAHASLSLAVLAFFLLDFSVQAIQAPLRALVTDVAPRGMLARGNAAIGFFTGAGNLLGGLLAGASLSKALPVFPACDPAKPLELESCNDVVAVFTTSAVVLVITVAVCVVATKEVPLRKGARGPATAPGSEPGSVRAARRDGLWKAVVNVPRPFWQVFAVQLCTWCGYFTLFVYVNTWVGTNVFRGEVEGDPTTVEIDLFHRGVRFGGMANAVQAVVTLSYSALLPKLLEAFGVAPVYVFSQAVEAACLLSAPFIRGSPHQRAPSRALKAFAMLDIASFGIVWATTMGVPWTLIGTALESDPAYGKQLGLYTTLFNASQSFPQLVVALVAPLVLHYGANDVSMVMFLGGLIAVVGAFLVVTLHVGAGGRKGLPRIPSAGSQHTGV